MIVRPPGPNVMAANGFSDDYRPLYMGPFHGFREFAVTDTGHLTGITFRQTWSPGENVARCFRTTTALSDTPRQDDWFTGWPPIQYTQLDHRRPDPCKGIELGCGCGFWSYEWTGMSTYAGNDTVTGVIAGYGRMCAGPKGFRAEKARIIALAFPGKHQAYDRVRTSRSRVTPELADLIRRNYPNVHFFRSHRCT